MLCILKSKKISFYRQIEYYEKRFNIITDRAAERTEQQRSSTSDSRGIGREALRVRGSLCADEADGG